MKNGVSSEAKPKMRLAGLATEEHIGGGVLDLLDRAVEPTTLPPPLEAAALVVAHRPSFSAIGSPVPMSCPPERRGWDSNPRGGLTRPLAFQASSLSHSDTSPGCLGKASGG